MFIKLLILNSNLISAQDAISGIKEIGGSISEYGRTLVMDEHTKVFVFDGRQNVTIGGYVSLYICSLVEDGIEPLYDRISKMIAHSFSPNAMMYKMPIMSLESLVERNSVKTFGEKIGTDCPCIPVNLCIDYSFLFALHNRPELVIEKTQTLNSFLEQHHLGYHVEHSKSEIALRTRQPDTTHKEMEVKESKRHDLSIGIIAAPRPDEEFEDEEPWDCYFSFQCYDHSDSHIEINLMEGTLRVLPDVREDTPLIKMTAARMGNIDVAIRDAINIAALGSRTHSVLAFEIGIPEFLNLERTYLV